MKTSKKEMKKILLVVLVAVVSLTTYALVLLNGNSVMLDSEEAKRQKIIEQFKKDPTLLKCHASSTRNLLVVYEKLDKSWSLKDNRFTKNAKYFEPHLCELIK
jgi:protoheme ferro-lyase